MPIVDDKVQDQIRYGHTCDLSRMPTVWTKSFDEALRYAKNDQPANRPFYIIELCEHFEVCGIVDKDGESWLASMPNDKMPNIYIKRGGKSDE